MNSNNFIVIQGWMCNELDLGGNELLIFALINGFSQDGVSRFSGGRKYIADTFNITLPTVDKALKRLLELNYIEVKKSMDHVHTDSYAVTIEVVKTFYQGSKESLPGSSKDSLPNNIDNNNTNNKNNNISSKEDILTENFDFGIKENKPCKTKNNLYTKCSAMIYNFTDIPALQKLLFTYLDLRLEIKDKPLYANQFKGMLNKLAGYTESATLLCEIVQQSIDRGYLSFFPVNNYKQGKSTHDAIHESGSGVVVNDTKEDAEKREQFRAKMEAEGKKAVF